MVREQLVSSSSWSSAYVHHAEDGARFFVKTAGGRDAGMFRGEALGLTGESQRERSREGTICSSNASPLCGFAGRLLQRLLRARAQRQQPSFSCAHP